MAPTHTTHTGAGVLVGTRRGPGAVLPLGARWGHAQGRGLEPLDFCRRVGECGGVCVGVCVFLRLIFGHDMRASALCGCADVSV